MSYLGLQSFQLTRLSSLAQPPSFSITASISPMMQIVSFNVNSSSLDCATS